MCRKESPACLFLNIPGQLFGGNCLRNPVSRPFLPYQKKSRLFGRDTLYRIWLFNLTKAFPASGKKEVKIKVTVCFRNCHRAANIKLKSKEKNYFIKFIREVHRDDG
jgi:hypothetical protein